MAESDRRLKYAYHRVLIETDRILDPQTDDAVVFLSGAQLEMLRNVTQYLNRRDTYVSEQFLDYYLSPTVDNYDTILAIVADLEETLMGNENTIWGYYDRWFQSCVETSVGDTFTIAESTPVPSGYVYVLLHVGAYHLSLVTKPCVLIVNVGGADPWLFDAPAVPHNEWTYVPTHFVLKEGDYVQWRVQGVPVDLVTVMRVSGYKMKVPD